MAKKNEKKLPSAKDVDRSRTITGGQVFMATNSNNSVAIPSGGKKVFHTTNIHSSKRQAFRSTDSGLKKTDTYTTLKNEFEKKKKKNGSSGGHGF